MLLIFLVFLASLFVLVKGSESFVESTARIAKRLGVSEFVIGLTFVSVGTSLPEIVTAMIASYTNNPGLIMGNIVGSNIVNIGLILGLSALFSTLAIDKDIFYRDGLIMLGVSLLFLLFSWNMVFSRLEGIVMLVIFCLYMVFLFKLFSTLRRQFELHEYLGEFFGFRRLLNIKLLWSIFKSGIDVTTYKKILDRGIWLGNTSISMVKKGLQVGTYYTILGQLYNRFKAGLVRDGAVSLISLLAVFFGAKYVVESASGISTTIGVPQTIVGLVMISLGTTLPELMVSISAVRKGLVNLLIGNIIGSNITNITLIPGISSLISPIAVTEISVYHTIPAMIFFSLVCLFFIRIDWKLNRNEGIALLMLYFAFLMWAIATS